MGELRAALHDVADRIADYREALPGRQVVPEVGRSEVRKLLLERLPDDPAPLETVIAELAAAAVPGLMSSAGPR